MGMIIIGILLIIATVIVTIFWPLPQLVYLIAAVVMSLGLMIASFVSLAGCDPVPYPLPVTIWLSLHGGACILSTFVQASWVSVVMNITRWWLPEVALYAWVIMILDESSN